MTKVYFVRHAQPLHNHEDDRTRPLTVEGAKDSQLVLKTLADKDIIAFYCSPYKRSVFPEEQPANNKPLIKNVIRNPLILINIFFLLTM